MLLRTILDWYRHWRPCRPNLTLHCPRNECQTIIFQKDTFSIKFDFGFLAIDSYYQWNPDRRWHSNNSSWRSHFKGHGHHGTLISRSNFSRKPPNSSVSRQDPDLVLNRDESSCKLDPNGFLTNAERRSQNLAIPVTGNEKDVITLMATRNMRAKHEWKEG
jgi:hypothetical protein